MPAITSKSFNDNLTTHRNSSHSDSKQTQKDFFIDCVVIPARGGSKRIPNKNLAPFLGIPMLERSIILAKQISRLVIVSSDSDAILESARNLGVIAHKRETQLADDMSPVLPVIVRVVTQLLDSQPQDSFYQESWDKESRAILPRLKLHSTVLCLYATAMFASFDSIKSAHGMLMDNPHIAYVVSVINNQKAYRAFKLDNLGNIHFLFPEFMMTRSQDLPQAYNDAGQFYLGFAKSYRNNIPLLGDKSMGIELTIAHDIDTQEDLQIAQFLKQMASHNSFNLA